MDALTADDPSRLGPYQLVRRLGAGGMGRVYLGRSPAGRPAAVKVVRPELADDTAFRNRFAREVAAARAVSGAYTAAVIDADTDAERPWLATVYVPGLSLAAAVSRHGPLPEAALTTLAAGLAEALIAVHAAGLVHRDLKPSNVMLASDGPKVIDFGVSRAVDASALTHTGAMIGSPGFMSPEQMTGGEIGTPCDVFALGALVAYAATGREPFGTGPTPGLVYRVVHAEPDLAGVPDGLRAVLARCLAKEPGDRPTPTALLDLLTAATTAPAEPPAVGTAGPPAAGTETGAAGTGAAETAVLGGRAWPPSALAGALAAESAAAREALDTAQLPRSSQSVRTEPATTEPSDGPATGPTVLATGRAGGARTGGDDDPHRPADEATPGTAPGAGGSGREKGAPRRPRAGTPHPKLLAGLVAVAVAALVAVVATVTALAGGGSTAASELLPGRAATTSLRPELRPTPPPADPDPEPTATATQPAPVPATPTTRTITTVPARSPVARQTTPAPLPRTTPPPAHVYSFSGGLARMSCAAEGSVTSARTTTGVLVTFRNNSPSAIRIYWLDFYGARVDAAPVVAPGDSYSSNSYQGHLWLIADGTSCLTIADAGQSGGTLTTS